MAGVYLVVLKTNTIFTADNENVMTLAADELLPIVHHIPTGRTVKVHTKTFILVCEQGVCRTTRDTKDLMERTLQTEPYERLLCFNFGVIVIDLGYFEKYEKDYRNILHYVKLFLILCYKFPRICFI